MDVISTSKEFSGYKVLVVPVLQITVSRVLNHDASLNVKDDTRNRIYEVAEELGYQTIRQRSRNLSKRIRIGVIHWYSQKEELGDPYYLSVAKGVEKECLSRKIEFASVFKDGEKYTTGELDDPEGFIAIGKFSNEGIQEFSTFSKNIVFVDSSPNDKVYDSVIVDIRSAAREILKNMFNSGRLRHDEEGCFQRRYSDCFLCSQ